MKENNELKKKMYEWTEKYVNKVGYRLNQDKEVLDHLLYGLAVMLKKLKRCYGIRKMVTENDEEDRKIVYPYFYL